MSDSFASVSGNIWCKIVGNRIIYADAIKYVALDGNKQLKH